MRKRLLDRAKDILAKHHLLLLGVFIAFICILLINYSLSENDKLRSGLLDSEFQRSAISLNTALKSSLANTGEISLTNDLQKKLDSIKASDTCTYLTGAGIILLF